MLNQSLTPLTLVWRHLNQCMCSICISRLRGGGVWTPSPPLEVSDNFILNLDNGQLAMTRTILVKTGIKCTNDCPVSMFQYSNIQLLKNPPHMNTLNFQQTIVYIVKNHKYYLSLLLSQKFTFLPTILSSDIYP